MPKVIVEPIGSFTAGAATTINTNFDRIAAALEKTLSRDGTVPNQMTQDLDMNHQDILNVQSITAETVVVDNLVYEDIDFEEIVAEMTVLRDQTIENANNSAESAADAEAAKESAEAAASLVLIVEFPTVALASAYAPVVAPAFLRTAFYDSTQKRNSGALYKNVGSSEPAHAGKFSITLSDLVTTVWYEISEAVLTDVMFGAPVDGQFDASTAVGTDGITQIQNWLDCPVSTLKKFTGVTRVSDTVDLLPGDTLFGEGYTTGLTGRQIVALTGTALLRSYGDDPVQVADLSGAVAKGDRSIALTDTTGLKDGDWICLWNSTPGSYNNNPSRLYHAGEWARILHVFSSTVLYLAEPLYASYAAADINVYTMDNPQTILRDFRIEAPFLENKTGIDMDKHISPIVENLKVSGAQHSNIWISRAVDIWVNNTAGVQTFDATPTNEYDIALSDIHGGEIHGSYYAQRHGIQMGTTSLICAVPNTRIMVYASTGNNHTTGSLDMGGHGCTRYCKAIGGSHVAIVTGGESNSFYGVTIRSATANNGVVGAFPFFGSEFHSGDFIFDSCIIECFDPATGGFPVDFALDGFTSGSCRFHFNNCNYLIEATSTVAISVRHTGTTFSSSVFVNGGFVRGGAALTTFVRLAWASGTTTIDTAVVRDIEGLNDTARRAAIIVAGGMAITKTILPEIVISKTFDPGSIASLSVETTTIATSGLLATRDGFAEPSFSLALGGLMLSATVTNSTTVTVTFFNPTGGAIDLGSGTLTVKLRRD